VATAPAQHKPSAFVRAALVTRERASTASCVRPDRSTNGPNHPPVALADGPCKDYSTLDTKRDSTVKQLHRFALDESGAEIIEYAVVTVILLLSTGLILSQIYDTVLDVMVSILKELTQ